MIVLYVYTYMYVATQESLNINCCKWLAKNIYVSLFVTEHNKYTLNLAYFPGFKG